MWLIGVPVFIGLIAILAIGGWVGWTMATTLPPANRRNRGEGRSY